MVPLDDDFDLLFSQVYGPLVRGLTVVADSGDDAADAVQDAFVQLHRHWRRVRGYDDPAAWIRRVALNRVRNQQRSRRRRNSAVERLTELNDDPEAAIVDAVQVRRALRSLPYGQRAAVGLYYLSGLGVAEVATALGIAEGTVKSQLHDARTNLAPLLEVLDG